MDSLKTGKIIAMQRRKLNMTQSMLAEILNVSNKTVSRWETGVTMPDISLLIPLCETLHISLKELLEGTEPVPEEDTLLKQTVQLSAQQLVRQKTVNKKLIMTLVVAGLLVFTLLPWAAEGGLLMSLPMIYGSRFWIVFILLAFYCISVTLCDQNKSAVSVISYILLGAVVLLLAGDLWLVAGIAQKASTAPAFRMTPVPVISIIYALGVIAVHHNLFTPESFRISFENLKIDAVHHKGNPLLLFALSVVMVILVCNVPVVNNGISSRILLEAFVERAPEWFGNYSNIDSYHGIILTLGYISLLVCPLLCLWSGIGNRAVFIMTDICLVHILACVLCFPLRFKIPLSHILPLEYLSACLLPVIMILLNHLMNFHRVFVKKEKEPVKKELIIIQLIYLIVTTVVFSRLFMVIPFVISGNTEKGEWYFLTLLVATALLTAAVPAGLHVLTSIHNKTETK